jgi:hypothetical protein
MLALITEFSNEFHDQEHINSNATQAMRLLKASGLSEPDFAQRIYEARSITKDRANIRTSAKGETAVRNRMPYFWAVLRGLLGMQEEQSNPPAAKPRQAVQGTSDDPERYVKGKYGHLVKH